MFAQRDHNIIYYLEIKLVCRKKLNVRWWTDSLTIERTKMFENTGDSLFYLFQNRFWISGRVLEGFLNLRKVAVEKYLLF